MAEQWRIFVVEDEQNLNRNMVSTLRKDGYFVQGVTSGADAVRALWSEEYDVLICDLKAGGSNAFELLEWCRIYRPNTRVIMVGFNSEDARAQALENGAASYLEKPLDLHVLKEELRRMLQQTGFSANLDSFDLLDVIQIIHMSRKSIALLVNTGVEEHGVLRFQQGDLIWAEYGLLHGEEAFFALAAHKNGTVLHQNWDEQITPNVRQPLSRLVLQALHYRAKYAPGQGEGARGVEEMPESTPPTNGLMAAEYDDTPFLVLNEVDDIQLSPRADAANIAGAQEVLVREANGAYHTHAPVAAPSSHPPMSKEWWEQTGHIPLVQELGEKERGRPAPFESNIAAAPTLSMDLQELTNGSIIPTTAYKTQASQRADLPSWLTEQPTSDLPIVRPSSLSNPASTPAASAEWSPPPASRTVERLSRSSVTGDVQPLRTDTAIHRAVSPEWASSEQMSQPRLHSIPLQSLTTSQTGPIAPSVPAQDSPALREQVRETEGPRRISGSLAGLPGSQRSTKRHYNYTALASALQTLGYSINGFIAAAVVTIEGQPIAQVTIDELDISRMCKDFSNILKSVLQSLDQGSWGEHEHIVITSSSRHILMRIAGIERNAFQVLITAREADPADSLEVMANIEGAISAALR